MGNIHFRFPFVAKKRRVIKLPIFSFVPWVKNPFCPPSHAKIPYAPINFAVWHLLSICLFPPWWDGWGGGFYLAGENFLFQVFYFLKGFNLFPKFFHVMISSLLFCLYVYISLCKLAFFKVLSSWWILVLSLHVWILGIIVLYSHKKTLTINLHFIKIREFLIRAYKRISQMSLEDPSSSVFLMIMRFLLWI